MTAFPGHAKPIHFQQEYFAICKVCVRFVGEVSDQMEGASEWHACRARPIAIDDTRLATGPDKRPHGRFERHAGCAQ